MPLIFVVTVYQLNDNQPLKTPTPMGFPPSAVIFRAAPAGSKAYDGTVLNGIVEVRSTGLNIGNPQWYVTQTVAQLATLANA